MWLLHLLLLNKPSSNNSLTTCSKTWTWTLHLSSSSHPHKQPSLIPSQWTSDKHHSQLHSNLLPSQWTSDKHHSQLHSNKSSSTVVYLRTWTSQRLHNHNNNRTWTSQRLHNNNKASPSSRISKINRQTIVSSITLTNKLPHITPNNSSPLLKLISLRRIGQQLLMFQWLLRSRMCGLRALICSI